MKRLMMTVAFAAGLVLPAFAVETVTPTPMKGDNMPAVGSFSYQAGDALPLPTIQWGADLTAVFANGNSEITQAGSIFDKAGLKVRLFRQDVFREQVRDYLSGKTPFLRGTVGMVSSASEALCEDARTCPQIFYNYSRSAGGDILLVNTAKGVHGLKDLKGKIIGLQADGPHMHLLGEMLAIAGMSVSDVKVQWYKDLGLDSKKEQSAAHAFQAGEVDAALVIYPDAVELEGGDGKVAGAKNVFSTKSLDRVIFDVLAVRPDFAKANPEAIQKLTNGLFVANEQVSKMFNDHGAPSKNTHEKAPAAYKALAAAGAKILLGVEGDVSFDNVMMEMRAFDLKMQNWTASVKFLTGGSDGKELVWLGPIATTAGGSFAKLGLLGSAAAAGNISAYAHDYEGLKLGLAEKFGVEAPRFNAVGAKKAVEKLVTSGSIGDKSIISFSIHFNANQMTFSPDLYAGQFEEVIAKMSKAGGAVVAVEGHSGTFRYLVQKYGKKSVPASTYRQTAQSAKNLSLRRAQAVISALRVYADTNGIDIPFNGIVPIGHGIEKPAAGMCAWKTREGARVTDPCGPDNKKDGAAWKTNEAGERRVDFTLVNVEGEADVFADDSF